MPSVTSLQNAPPPYLLQSALPCSSPPSPKRRRQFAKNRRSSDQSELDPRFGGLTFQPRAHDLRHLCRHAPRTLAPFPCRRAPSSNPCSNAFPAPLHHRSWSALATSNWVELPHSTPLSARRHPRIHPLACSTIGPPPQSAIPRGRTDIDSDFLILSFHSVASSNAVA
jgi:hypothetical protein